MITRTVHIGMVAIGLVLLTGSAQAQMCFGRADPLPGPINTPANEWGVSLSADGLMLLYFSDVPEFMYWATRPTLDAEFGPGELIPNVNASSSGQGHATLSFDSLELYFSQWGGGGFGGWDIMVATRDSTDGDFGDPTALGDELNTVGRDFVGYISPDGLTLYLTQELIPLDLGTSRLFTSTRSAVGEPWSQATIMSGPVNDAQVVFPALTEDELTVFFSSTREGGLGDFDMWMASRSTRDEAFSDPVNLGPNVNSSAAEIQGAWFGEIEAALYFSSDRQGTPDIFLSPVLDIECDCDGDVNDDGTVDPLDSGFVIARFGCEYPDDGINCLAADVNGDGIVDPLDVGFVLARFGECS